jgi:hypothetical protein
MGFFKDLFKTKRVRVCNDCALMWNPEEDQTEKSGYVKGFLSCPYCGTLNTEWERDWHRENPERMEERRKNYLKYQAEQKKEAEKFEQQRPKWLKKKDLVALRINYKFFCMKCTTEEERNHAPRKSFIFKKNLEYKVSHCERCKTRID